MCGFEKDQLSWRLWTVSRLVTFHHGNNNVPALLLESVSRPQGTETLTYCVAYCVTTHSSNVIVKFVDDTTVVGLITDDNESAYREEVHSLKNWCHNSNLSLNISKTKELVVDFRRRTSEHSPPITIDRTPVEQVSSFKFLGVNITEELSLTTHTQSVVGKAHQHLLFLKRLKKFGRSSKILRKFYSCTVESILTALHHPPGTELHRSQPESPEETAQHIVEGELPSLQEIYPQRCVGKHGRSSEAPAT